MKKLEFMCLVREIKFITSSCPQITRVKKKTLKQINVKKKKAGRKKKKKKKRKEKNNRRVFLLV